ncbi:GntR family transcriptional regulator [Saccharopolyspora erythraea NRRL 2338]|uniref:Possible transcriptional regulator, GntR family n=3 Tax=Saccharopolyspora erythraea TaxID=1836 RepID=A4FJV2_SACEN|nr:GntR family transcriptional regulator [Saccharopolyspora erythraea NRRL 2338]QRK88093.1 GntR family transcriptional regulator [Saccharopolyspora erythraea]CAM04327.1 possible transcriptional regulator, GntR family [Saccharopolyspora erythraea NRRL 2338]
MARWDEAPVERPRMSDAAYERLKDAIVSGEFAPGEKIRDSEVAQRLGLSRTPVREALTRLADTGLVEAKPGVYTRITTLNRHDVAATLVVLRSLDELAVRTGVPHMTTDHIDRMRRANEDFAHAVDQHDITGAFAADDAFHGVAIDAAGNPVLRRVIDQLHPQVHRILYRKFSTLLGGHDTVDHHTKLTELCANGDADGAAGLSAEHWAHLGGLIDELFASDDLDESSA